MRREPNATSCLSDERHVSRHLVVPLPRLCPEPLCGGAVWVVGGTRELERARGLPPPCPTTLCVWKNLPYLTLHEHDHFCLERVLRDDFSSSKRLERRRRPRRPAASSPRRSLRSRGSDERGWSLVPPRRGRADSLTTTRRCVRRCARVRMGVSVRRGSRWRGGASQSAMVR